MVPDDIPELPEHWQRVREPLAAGDRHEAIKRLRLLLDHEPFALAPRHALASFVADEGNESAALVQFEKLLTAAVTRGDLFRAIAAQRRVDELSRSAPEPATYQALQRWFRLAGEANLLPAPEGGVRGLTPVRLLRLPAEVFAWVAIRSRLQRLETGWHIEPIGGACQWHLLWGALRWEMGRRDARGRQHHLSEGQALFAEPDARDHAPLRIAADVPSEALVLEPDMLRQIATVDPFVLAESGDDGIVHDARPRTPLRPGTASDLDAQVPAPDAPAVDGPPVLRIEHGVDAETASADISDWLEPGLEPSGDDASGAAAAPLPEVPGLQRGITTFTRATRPNEPPVRRRPPRGTAGEIELPVPGSQAPPRARRRRDRTPVSYRGRVRLLGLEQAAGIEIDCRLVDLSADGVRIELPTDSVLPLVRMLEGETLRLDLEPSAGGLELAGRVCWLDLQADKPVHAGIEFVLLTRADRRAIDGLVARARAAAGGCPPGPGDAAPDGAAA